ncbi:MAG: cupin domain-containing protein [Spirochaetota bacterium]
MSDIPKKDELVSEGLLIEEMISYQEGSVVSRTLLQKDTGTVTLFAFDRGEGLSEHTTPFDAMVQVLDGTAAITISGLTYTIKKGEMLLMPAGEPHSLQAVESFKMMLIMIKEK